MRSYSKFLASESARGTAADSVVVDGLDNATLGLSFLSLPLRTIEIVSFYIS